MTNNLKVFVEESEKYYKDRCLDLIKNTEHLDPCELGENDKKLYWCFIGKYNMLNELKKMLKGRDYI